MTDEQIVERAIDELEFIQYNHRINNPLNFLQWATGLIMELGNDDFDRVLHVIKHQYK